MSQTDPFSATDAALQAKTERSLTQWVETARQCPASGHMAVVGWLKAQHGLGHGHANSVVHALNASAAISQDGGELIEAMFAGPKAAMRPVHDAVLAALAGIGGDIELAPKKGYLSFRRSKQFGLGQPSTKDRYDLGLSLKGEPAAGRLEVAGSWNAMVTHRVRLASPAEVDAELIGWLRAAYERA
jgi:Domain of unknown function (DUF5655)/Domain of unknown function (DUF4287)